MRSLQALPAVISLIVGLSLLHADPVSLTTRPSPATPPTTVAQLTAECDALLQAAVRRPYGWAWPTSQPNDANLPRGAAIVSFDPHATSTAGLLLYQASQSLGNERYTQAAIQVARGIAASQQSSGRIPNLALFATFASPRDPVQPIPDRSATCAALGLLLTLADDPHIQKQDPSIRRAATRAATWLADQQPPTGGWIALGERAASARNPTDNATRLSAGPSRFINLDSPDYRNSTLALLYAYEVLQDPAIRRSAEKALDPLLKLRRNDPDLVNGLWHSSYDLRGQPTSPTDQLDLLACRFALQTLLAAHLTLGGQPTLAALDTAARALQTLETSRQKLGVNYRYYSLQGQDLVPMSGSANPFFGPAPQATELSDLLATLAQVRQVGRVAYQDLLGPSSNLKQHLAQAICGLSDDPPSLFLPMERVQMSHYIALRNKDLWDAPPGASPQDLPARLRRIHALILKLSAERMAADAK